MARATADVLADLGAEFGFDAAALPDGARMALTALSAQLADAQALADVDSLTGALNRRAFLRELTRAGAYLARYGGDAAVVFLDLDGFKSINDTYGHAAGDAVLRAVARLLQSHLRDSDVLGRMGGDEFAAILMHADPERAARKAEALANRLRAAAFSFDGRALRLTASIGWHPVNPREDAESIVARADEAMYARRALARGAIAPGYAAAR